MRCFSTTLIALFVCGGTLLGVEWKAFITSTEDSGSVIPIGTSSYEQGSSVVVEDTPRAIAITPDAKTALVANYGSDTISVVDIATGETSSVDLPIGTLPENIAITPDGKKAVVVGGSNPYYYYRALVLNLATTPISIETEPFPLLFGASLAITTDGKWALIGGVDQLEGSISILDLTTTPASFKTNFISGFFEGGIAVTPDGSRAIAVTQELNTATMIDLTAQPSPYQIHTVAVGPSPIDVAITSDGERALVLFTGQRDVPAAGISVLNLTTAPMSVQTLNVFLPEDFIPSAIAITPDGTKAVITRSRSPAAGLFGIPATPPSSSDVLFYDLTTDPISLMSTPIFTIEAATDVAITPDQAPTARFTCTKHGRKATFDASDSTSPVGSIRQYHWKFGDHHKKTTTAPVVKHKYEEGFCGKSVGVKLTVTNTAGTSTKVLFTGRTVSNNGGPSAVCKHHVKFSSRFMEKDPLVTCTRGGVAARPLAHLSLAQ